MNYTLFSYHHQGMFVSNFTIQNILSYRLISSQVSDIFSHKPLQNQSAAKGKKEERKIKKSLQIMSGNRRKAKQFTFPKPSYPLSSCCLMVRVYPFFSLFVSDIQ